MEQIRENLFFVVTGVVVVLCLAFVFNPWLSVMSWEAKNRAMDTEVKKLEGKLKEWANKKDLVPNESAIKAAKAYQAEYTAVFEGGEGLPGHMHEGVKNYFAQKKLSTSLPGLEEANQDDAPGYLRAYREATGKLMKELQDAGIRAEAGAWSFWNWGEVPPYSKEQREEATREYWLTSHVLDVIQQKVLNVVHLDRLEINPGVEKNANYNEKVSVFPRKGDYFDAIPFTLEVRMQFQMFPQLIAKLLTMSTPVNVERISISRLSDEERKTMKGRVPPTWVVVRVKLHCVALNYQEKKESVAAGTTVGGGAAARGVTSNAGVR